VAPHPHRPNVRVSVRGQRLLLLLAALAFVSFIVGASSGSSAGSDGPVGFIKFLPQVGPSQYEQLERARANVLSYTDYVSQGAPNKNEVALTFDDGPGVWTPQVLKILNSTHTPATFFELGQNITEFPAAAQAVAVGGYPIGDHTVDHKDLRTLSAADQAAEIDGMITTAKQKGLSAPVLFRPPYGSYNKDTIDILAKRKMIMALWAIDSEDWTMPGADVIVQNVLGSIKAGDIVLMHDAGGDRSQTVAALPRIIAGLKQKGLKPVTVPQLLADDPPPRDQAAPAALAGG
jgi:peptidoglycan/xylan/chitin deacetylase (PgdA/CDA1 family)